MQGYAVCQAVCYAVGHEVCGMQWIMHWDSSSAALLMCSAAGGQAVPCGAPAPPKQTPGQIERWVHPIEWGNIDRPIRV